MGRPARLGAWVQKSIEVLFLPLSIGASAGLVVGVVPGIYGWLILPVAALLSVLTVIAKIKQQYEGRKGLTRSATHKVVYPSLGALVPHQLPPSPRRLIGRQYQLDQLSSYWSQRAKAGLASIIAISGPPGVGKRALALGWLHSIRNKFADGEIYIKLRSPDSSNILSKDDVIGRIFRAFGMPGENVPNDLDEMISLYRTIISDRKAILFLDDVSTADEISYLVPTGPSIMVVIGDSQLSDLVILGAHLIRLDPLNQAAAIELLGDLVGLDRVRRESTAAELLVQLCECLPLVIHMTAARLIRRPACSIATQVAEFENQLQWVDRRPIDPLAAVWASLDLTYQGLSPSVAQLYARLSLQPGPNFGAAAARVLTDLPVAEVGLGIQELLEMNLLQEDKEGRYSFGPLVRAHAEDRARAIYSDGDLRGAMGLVVEWYLRVAKNADHSIAPYRKVRRYGLSQLEDDLILVFKDRQDALEWLVAERQNIVAASELAERQELWEACWHICDALWSLMLYRKQHAERMEIDRRGLVSAQKWGDRASEADMLKRLGGILGQEGEFDEAIERLNAAIDISANLGNSMDEANARADLGRVYLNRGDTTRARQCLERAMQVHQAAQATRELALTLINLGRLELVIGRDDGALIRFGEARDLLKTHVADDPFNYARALLAFGEAAVRAGQYQEAGDHLASGLELMRRYKCTYRAGEISALLGEIAEYSGDIAAARSSYEFALQKHLNLSAVKRQEVEERLIRLL
jgi:tetratricopeptide (TPR) repeat protein